MSDAVEIDKSYLLPLFPSNFDLITARESHQNYSYSTDKKIPRNIFINFREVPPKEVLYSDKYYSNLKSLLEKHITNDWKIHLFGQNERKEFMNKYFNNTSILWAYNQINPIRQVATSDIWRYCALYIFGGLYIDDDIGLHANLDDIIQPEEQMIISLERNIYNDCYNQDYHLSELNASSLYHKSVDSIRNIQ